MITDTVTLLNEIKYYKRNKIRMTNEEMCNVVSVIKQQDAYFPFFCPALSQLLLFSC